MWRGGSAHLFEVELLEPALGDGLEHVDLCGGEGRRRGGHQPERQQQRALHRCRSCRGVCTPRGARRGAGPPRASSNHENRLRSSPGSPTDSLAETTPGPS